MNNRLLLQVAFYFFNSNQKQTSPSIQPPIPPPSPPPLRAGARPLVYVFATARYRPHHMPCPSLMNGRPPPPSCWCQFDVGLTRGVGRRGGGALMEGQGRGGEERLLWRLLHLTASSRLPAGLFHSNVTIMIFAQDDLWRRRVITPPGRPMISAIGNRWAIRAPHQSLLLSSVARFFRYGAIRFNMLSSFSSSFFSLTLPSETIQTNSHQIIHRFVGFVSPGGDYTARQSEGLMTLKIRNRTRSSFKSRSPRPTNTPRVSPCHFGTLMAPCGLNRTFCLDRTFLVW